VLDPLVIAFAAASSSEDTARFWHGRLDVLSDTEAEMVATHVRNRYEHHGNRGGADLEDVSVPAYQWLRSYMRKRDERIKA
jgi:hypothetical protein